jgi:hypothetical protein
MFFTVAMDKRVTMKISRDYPYTQGDSLGVLCAFAGEPLYVLIRMELLERLERLEQKHHPWFQRFQWFLSF